MIKNFGDFLNENLSDRRIADAVIYTCLLGFLPDGGNNNGEDDWEKVDKIFKDGGPDLFRNFGPDEFKSNGTYDELVALSKMYGKRSDSWSDTESNHRYLTNEAFGEFDLKIEKITPDETIIHLSPQKQSGVKQFYTELRPAYLKELAEKLKTHISSKQYGL